MRIEAIERLLEMVVIACFVLLVFVPCWVVGKLVTLARGDTD